MVSVGTELNVLPTASILEPQLVLCRDPSVRVSAALSSFQENRLLSGGVRMGVLSMAWWASATSTKP
jgi:hypothetical protein